MWEKINKLSVQVIIAVIVIIASFLLLFVLTTKEIPVGNRDLFNVLIGTVIGSALTPVIGWLFTTSKHPTNNRNEPKPPQP